MCGIAGGTGHGAALRSVVASQLATLERRGPDSWGLHVGVGGAVGQTRLAVIDLETGDPPITDESGQLAVALNGEIYNYEALRRRLLSTGHLLTTRGDTEVIAHLAEDLEPVELAAALEGMFAFAVWDGRHGRLILGRDRLGKKPLYYWVNGDQLVFGSELKAVLRDPRVPRRLDAEALPGYLAFGYAPSPGTFFEGVRSLPPASVLVHDERGTTVQRYWDAPAAQRGEMLTASSGELAAELRRHLTVAVRDRLVADVPLGAFLSGGLDSSVVVGLMAEASSRPVRTFAIGFEEAAYDERRWARLVAERFGTEHVEEVVRPDASRVMDDVLDGCDQPFADSSAVPMYLLAGVARRDVTVALSGDGGDELFAGYERFAAAIAVDRVGRRLPASVAANMRRAAAKLGGADQRGMRARAARLLSEVGHPMPEAYSSWVRVFAPSSLQSVLGGVLPDVDSWYQDMWTASAGAPLLSRLMDLNRRTYLVDDLLVKVDRMSMAHGLEVRSPLLDHRLVEFAVRVPPQQHMRGPVLKRLLKLAVADLVPAEVVRRRKKGFGVPLDDWFRGPLREEVRARLLDPGARVRQHLDGEGIAALVTEHDAGRGAHGQRLWSLLMLERFLERESW